MKRILSLVLALILCTSLAVPALAGNMLGWAYRRAVPKEGRGTV